MNIVERLRCIKNINSQAHCVVWEDRVAYDPAHVGSCPTLAECETVLTVVQSEITVENEEKENQRLIDEEKNKILEAQAIANLKTANVLPSDYKSGT